MRTLPAAAVPRRGPPLSRRLLALAGDDRLVEQIRGGNDQAFEVAYDRHAAAILSFCRHMLGSREEAEDAVQHTFTSAYRDLLGSDREVALKPWLYAIARNRCVSMLRARRETPAEFDEPSTEGLVREVERRAELRELLADLADLPEQQRAALVLSELGDLTHAEVAEVVGCAEQQVKGIVFRARSGLGERREAREAPCEEIREELATLRGGALRRSRLRHHLRVCEGCAEFREEVRRQRSLMGILLPVAPTAGLKAGVLGAVGAGGAAGGGGLLGLGAVGSAGVLVATKVVAIGALAGGLGLTGGLVLNEAGSGDPAPPPAQTDVLPGYAVVAADAAREAALGPAGPAPAAERRRARRGRALALARGRERARAAGSKGKARHVKRRAKPAAPPGSARSLGRARSPERPAPGAQSRRPAAPGQLLPSTQGAKPKSKPKSP